jgi:hypothetical protein
LHSASRKSRWKSHILNIAVGHLCKILGFRQTQQCAARQSVHTACGLVKFAIFTNKDNDPACKFANRIKIGRREFGLDGGCHGALLGGLSPFLILAFPFDQI